MKTDLLELSYVNVNHGEDHQSIIDDKSSL